MEITEQAIVGDIVAENYKASAIFKKHKIDFCCNGNRSIDAVCKEKSIETKELINELESTLKESSDSHDYDSWDIGFLADYIYNTHHKYIENKIPEIKQYLNKICSVHGSEHPELFEIRTLFFSSGDDLTQHLKKEELILFPFIKKLAELKKNGQKLEEPVHFGTVENPISMMMHEHDMEGVRFRKIAELTNDYTPPKDACNSYKTTFALLKEFEEDLHKHIHLESNILFKKAIKLEKELRA